MCLMLSCGMIGNQMVAGPLVPFRCIKGPQGRTFHAIHCEVSLVTYLAKIPLGNERRVMHESNLQQNLSSERNLVYLR
jgi:hypothetical protein